MCCTTTRECTYSGAGHSILTRFRGIYVPPIDQLTVQGYDAQFGVHVLGHFYLTQLLLPALLAGAQASGDGTARIVNTSSSASIAASGIDYGTLRDTHARTKLGRGGLYAQSKLVRPRRLPTSACVRTCTANARTVVHLCRATSCCRMSLRGGMASRVSSLPL